jgi:hypothetical protein
VAATVFCVKAGTVPFCFYFHVIAAPLRPVLKLARIMDDGYRTGSCGHYGGYENNAPDRHIY